MQQALRPHATAGIALLGAGMIAVAPVSAPPPSLQVRSVQLVDAWSDLFTNTVANLDNIVSNANSSDISQVFSALLTNPLGVIDALTNLDPTVTTGTSVPLQISVELTPALEYILGQIGADGATIQAIDGVVSQLQADPSNAFNILYEGTATVLNAYLNGEDNVSLLGGIIDIPLFNGILAPEQTASVDINLTDLLNALGLGNLDLSSLNLSDLLSQLGLGHLTIGQLFTDLNLSSDGLGTLLADGSSNITTLGGLWDFLGLGGLTEGLGTALNNAGLLSGLVTDLGNLVPLATLETALNNISLGTLLGDNTTDITTLLNNTLNLGDLLSALGLSDVQLSGLPGILDLGNLSNLTLADLLGDLGLGNLADVSVSPLGGLVTELVDTVPQQILAAI
ncbi:MAG: hypothetical protein JO082_11810 [Mycobacterium sp.]|nr:hypothetical protein [Mycobacterium sp.]